MAQITSALSTKVFLALGLTIVAALAVMTTVCPCGPAPGLWLLGEKVEEPITDWTFANSEPLCQIQVNTWRPHSINLNCMSANKALYVSCSKCADKSWSNVALANPQAMIRIGENVYPVNLSRLTEATALDIAWTARLAKIDRPSTPRPDHWWSFQLSSP